MKTLEIPVQLNVPIDKIHQLEFATEMGYLKLPEQTFSKDDDGRCVLKFDVSDDMHKHLRVTGNLTEVVRVNDRETKKAITPMNALIMTKHCDQFP